MKNEEAKTLLVAAEAADRALRAARAEKDAWIFDRRTEIDAQAYEKFDARISAGIEAARTARRIAEEAVYAATVTDTGWLPVGTKVVKHKRLGRGLYSNRTEPVYGMVEVWGPDSVRPGNREHYPSVGRVIVRLLRADGSLSLMYDDSTWGAGRGGWEAAP